MFQNDYILRQIEMFTSFLARVLFNKENTIFESLVDEAGNPTEAGELYPNLRVLVKAGKINEAENLLFERAKATLDPQYLELALDFYSHLSHLDQSFLKEHDFTVEEISEGLAVMRRLYNVEDITP